MVRVIISVSIDESQYDYCKRMGLKPSHLLREAILKHHETYGIEELETTKHLRAKLARLADTIQQQADELSALRGERGYI